MWQEGFIHCGLSSVKSYPNLSKLCMFRNFSSYCSAHQIIWQLFISVHSVCCRLCSSVAPSKAAWNSSLQLENYEGVCHVLSAVSTWKPSNSDLPNDPWKDKLEQREGKDWQRRSMGLKLRKDWGGEERGRIHWWGQKQRVQYSVERTQCPYGALDSYRWV